MVANRLLSHIQVIDVLVRDQTQKFLIINDWQMRYPEYIHPGQGLLTCI